MTSLIDVIFLLLLFFMLSSTFSRFADVELGTAGGSSSAAQKSVPAFVKLSGERVLLNGIEFTQETLTAEIERLKASAHINAVIVAVEDSANAQQLVDMLLVLRKSPGLSVQIVH